MMTVLAIAVSSIFGAVISRWHGGGWNIHASKSLKNCAWAFPLSFLSAVETESIVIGIAAFALCLAGKATGHGRIWNPFTYLDLGKKPEKVEYLTFWLIDTLPDFYYKILCLSLVGFAAVSGAAFAIGYVNIWAGLIAAAGGALGKPIGYLIGWKQPWIEGNAFGELFTGLAAYGAVTYALLLY